MLIRQQCIPMSCQQPLRMRTSGKHHYRILIVSLANCEWACTDQRKWAFSPASADKFTVPCQFMCHRQGTFTDMRHVRASGCSEQSTLRFNESVTDFTGCSCTEVSKLALPKSTTFQTAPKDNASAVLMPPQ